jgi:NIPSNAP
VGVYDSWSIPKSCSFHRPIPTAEIYQWDTQIPIHFAVTRIDNLGTSAKMPAMQRRTLLQSLPAAAILPYSFWAAPLRNNDDSMPPSTTVYELRVYHTALGKLNDLLARFRDHTIKLFDKHGIKSVAYWTPADEPEKSNTLIYILQHPSREAAAANWKAFQDDPDWKAVREKSEADGKLVEKVDSTYMTFTEFSPPLT